ncbi:MAG TPA: hypothetical protein VI462_17380 [Acidimicrobiia bacterium]
MRRADLLKRIARQARANNVTWQLVREGRQHEIWLCGAKQVSIPRHREINTYTAEAIMKDLASELGAEWWR